MKEHFFRVSFFVLVFSFFLLAGRESVFAIGISPSVVDVKDASNNIDIPKTVFISRGNPSKDENFSVTPIGNGAKYLKLPAEPFFLPKGSVSTPYTFSIHPVGAPNGNYEVALIFNNIQDPNEKAGEGNGMSLSIGVRGKVTFNVTDKEVKNFSFVNFAGQDTEENQPVSFYYTLQNDGNVDARPDKIVYQFVDEADTAHIYNGEVNGESLELVAPGQKQVVAFGINGKFTQGRYHIRLSFYSAGEVVATSQDIIVSIFPAGTLKQQAEVKSLDISKTFFEPGEIVTFSGTLHNSGDIAVEPTMHVQIEKDQKQLDKVDSDKKTLLRDQDSEFEVIYRPTEKGVFQAKAYFEYGINKTEVKTFEFRVGKPSNTLYIAIGGGIFFLLVIIFVVAKKFVSKDDEDDIPTNPTSTNSDTSSKV